MELVKNHRKYWEFIRVLRSNENVQSGFIEQVRITKKQQEQYMGVHKDNYLICLNNGTPVGYIGAVNDDLRICVSPEYQRRGFAKFMILEFMKIVPQLMSKVKHGNIASQNLFLACGFKEYKRDSSFVYFQNKELD